MGYGQTWLFRYPAPRNEALHGAEREYSRQGSYYDLDEVTEDEPTATVNRDKDVAAFHMTPIAADRILVTMPWAVCELQYLQDTRQFDLSPVGLTAEKERHSDLDYALAMLNPPHDSALLECDVLHLSEDRHALMLLYQEPKGHCCLALQPFGVTPSSHSNQRQRFEQSAVPLHSIKAHVRNDVNQSFHGVVLFRNDSIVAYGYLQSPNEHYAPQAIQLSAQEFASFFPFLCHFHHPVVSYHSTIADNSRLVVLGCANGVVKLIHGKSQLDGLESVQGVRQFELDGPISAVNVFNARVSPQGDILCDVLVSSSIGYALVYHNPFHSSFATHFLPESDYFDSILCCLSADIDMDGHPELLLGTFSNALIAYKQDSQNGASWRLLSKSHWDFFFFGPVYSIVCQDMNGDGVDEIIIASTDGIHVLEPDCDQVLEKLQSVLALVQK